MHIAGILPACALAAGVLFALSLSLSVGWLLIALAPLPLIAFACWWHRAASGVMVTSAAAFCIAGAALATDARERTLHGGLRARLDEYAGGFLLESLGPGGQHDPVLARVRLQEDAADAGDVVLLRGAVLAIRLEGTWRHIADEGVRMTVGGVEARRAAGEWRAGRTLEAPVLFRRPARFLNDGVPDFERDLALDGTTLSGSVKSGLAVSVVAAGTRVEEAAAAVRAHVRRAVFRHVASHDPLAAAIVVAVLIGDRTGLPDEVRDRLQAAGTYHVIAISGGNIAILAGLVLLALMAVGVHGRPAALIALTVLGLYSQIVTAGPSVWRATVMAVLYLLARLVDHRTPPWHAIFVAGALMLVVRPLDLRDPGFVLTFGATAALLAGGRMGLALSTAGGGSRFAQAGPAGRLLRNRAVRWIMASVLASAAVELALTPVSAQAFSRVTVAGLLLNLFAVPLMAVVQVAGMAVVVSDSLSAIARPAGWLAYASAAVLVDSARVVEVMPSLARSVPPPGSVILAAYYLGLAALLCRRRSMRAAGIAIVIASWLAVVLGLSARWRQPPALLPRPVMRLTVFDVGQAEALLLESPGAGPLMIDAAGVPFGGGGFDVARRVLAPAMWARGVRSLDTLLITHGDPDHVGGAAGIVDVFAPRRLWTGVPVPRHQPSQEIVVRAARSGLDVREVRRPEARAWGAARIRVLHPPEPDWERQRVRNDDSVVIEVVLGDVALLLTGDISAEIERAIAPRLTPAAVRILKVAHHGSRTSTSADILNVWRPQIALISCGRGNTFGHPAREVLERLRAAGVQVFRTDRDGQITLETDGRQVRVRTFWEGGR